MEPIKKMISDKSYVLITTRPNGTRRCITHNLDPSLTIDENPEKSDINYIIKNFQRTGHLPLSNRPTVYDELGQVPRTTDLLSAAILIQDATEKFNQLPAQTRERFENEPSKLISFLNDPNNFDEAIKLGLLPKRDEPNDAITPPVPDPIKPL